MPLRHTVILNIICGVPLSEIYLAKRNNHLIRQEIERCGTSPINLLGEIFFNLSYDFSCYIFATQTKSNTAGNNQKGN